ncbi:MAG: ABC transporter permease, partial [Bdellovibrionales bacterium]|nr:ABC transporter permease [Bdellovibrionales bacterium]
SLAHPFWLIYFLCFGGLTFANIGISVAFWAKTIDQMTAVSSFILTPLLYLGGVFFSVENLDSFWQGLSRANPLLYLINGVRHGLVGVSDVSVEVAAGVAMLFLVVTYCIALLSLRRGSFLRW